MQGTTYLLLLLAGDPERALAQLLGNLESTSTPCDVSFLSLRLCVENLRCSYCSIEAVNQLPTRNINRATESHGTGLMERNFLRPYVLLLNFVSIFGFSSKKHLLKPTYFILHLMCKSVACSRSRDVMPWYWHPAFWCFSSYASFSGMNTTKWT